MPSVNQSASSEPGQMRCSDLDMPLLTFEDLGMVKNYLRYLSYKHWTKLDRDAMNKDATRLCNMCQIIIDNISALVLETVVPQVLSMPHVHVPTDDKGATSYPINGEPLLDGCSYCRVTEDDIQGAFDNILEKCFGLALGVKQKRSNESDRLRTLFSAKIAMNVNSKLRHITRSTSLQSDESILPSDLKEMADHAIRIVITCTNPQLSLEANEFIKSEQDSAKTYTLFETVQQLDDCLDFLDSLNFGSLDSKEDERVQISNVKGFQRDGAKTSDIIPSTTKNTDSLQCLSAMPLPDLPTCPDDELFLTGCLTNPQISLETTEDKKFDAAQHLDDCLDFLDSLNLGSLDSEEDEPVQISNVKGFQRDGAKTFDIIPSTTKNTDFLPYVSAMPLPDLPTCSDDELFLTECLTKLVSHIANETHTTAINLDFHQIVTQVKERIVDEQSYALLQNSKNLHITIYTELCHKFGSKYLFLAVMEKDDVAFVEALAELLNAQLKKLTGEKSSKNMQRTSRGNNKIFGVSTNNSPESHSEEHKQRNGSTPSHQNKKSSRNTRTTSSLFSYLRKAFTFCIICQD